MFKMTAEHTDTKGELEIQQRHVAYIQAVIDTIPRRELIPIQQMAITLAAQAGKDDDASLFLISAYRTISSSPHEVCDELSGLFAADFAIRYGYYTASGRELSEGNHPLRWHLPAPMTIETLQMIADTFDALHEQDRRYTTPEEDFLFYQAYRTCVPEGGRLLSDEWTNFRADIGYKLTDHKAEVARYENRLPSWVTLKRAFFGVLGERILVRFGVITQKQYELAKMFYGK